MARHHATRHATTCSTVRQGTAWHTHPRRGAARRSTPRHTKPCMCEGARVHTARDQDGTQGAALGTPVGRTPSAAAFATGGVMLQKVAWIAIGRVHRSSIVTPQQASLVHGSANGWWIARAEGWTLVSVLIPRPTPCPRPKRFDSSPRATPIQQRPTRHDLVAKTAQIELRDWHRDVA